MGRLTLTVSVGHEAATDHGRRERDVGLEEGGGGKIAVEGTMISQSNQAGLIAGEILLGRSRMR